ncbi:MAG: hypothetical protein IKZ25_01440 [Clostridia bacterium]|nr:hypothetical protein [Clostridia bacterium]
MKTQKKKQNSFTTFDVLLCILAVIMMLGLVISSVQLSDVSKEIRICKNQIEELQSDEKKLEVEMEKKLNLRNIEEIAKNELGLSKIEKSQIHYLSIVSDDKIQLSNNDNSESTVGNALSSLVRSFNILLEYLS